jgi:MoaA/NifB/PqqE/SkfB family radical SAM enzyme
MPFERISIEVTNRCAKACAFCYTHSLPEGDTRWTTAELVAFVRDCAGSDDATIVVWDVDE